MVERAKSGGRSDKEKPAPVLPRSSSTVTVACKLPSGIIMRLFKMEEMQEPAPGGTRTIKKARQVGETFQIRGVAVPFGVIPSFRIVGGYALTPGVPRQFWEDWLEQNEELELVKNKLIFAHEQQDYVVDKAKDQASIRSGLEPIDPDNPPKISNNKFVKLERADASDMG